MEEENFYRLFYPLSINQKKEILKIWMDNIEDDIYVRKDKIEKYCNIEENENKNKCDFLTALYHIYENIFDRYICYYNIEKDEKEYKYLKFHELKTFLRKRIENFLNSGIAISNEQINFLEEILNILEKEYFYNSVTAKKRFHFKFKDLYIDYIDKLSVVKDEMNLSEHINIICEKRQKNKKEYIDDRANTKVKIPLNKQFILLTSPEKHMYIPECEIYQEKDTETETNYVISNIEIEDTIHYNLTIGTYDVDKTKQLYEECNNIVFKSCTIEDFVNSLNNPDECNIKEKNKSLLYVLYTYFPNFFKDEAEIKRDMLNDKFGINYKDFQKHKYPNKNPSGTQEKFNKILSEI